MAVPTTREEFKQYVLRKLGAPVIEINVEDDQVEDRIDEALKFYADYHFDGSTQQYLKHQLTEQDLLNGYITLPENIIGAVGIFNAGIGSGPGNMFSIQYQIALNDLYTLTQQSIVPFYMTMQHLALLQEIFSGQLPIRYNRHGNRLYIDGSMGTRWAAGQWIIVEAYEVLDPEQFSDVWSDRWLQNYTTALVGVQWGSNITKFNGMTLPGGVQFNGEQILQRYSDLLTKLEEEMINTHSAPLTMFIG